MAVKSIEQVEDTIKKYHLLLHNAGLPVEKIILFGSYSTNRQNENSDIDIAVILKNFTEDKFETRLKLMKFCRSFEEVIELHPFLEEEFNSSNPFVSEILKHGIVIC